MVGQDVDEVLTRSAGDGAHDSSKSVVIGGEYREVRGSVNSVNKTSRCESADELGKASRRSSIGRLCGDGQDLADNVGNTTVKFDVLYTDELEKLA